MSKFLTVVLLLALSVCLFAEGTKEGVGAKPVTLEWWFGSWSAENPTEAPQLVKDFTAAYPNITLKQVPLASSGFYEKVVAALTAKTGPDLVEFQSAWAPQLVTTGSLLDVTDMLSKIGKDAFVPAALAMNESNGRYYGFPYRTSTDCIFLNTAMLSAAGLKDPPRTLQEYIDYAVKLTHKDSNGVVDVYGAALDLNRKDSTVASVWFRWVLDSFGGDFLSPDGKKATLNTPAALKAFSFYKDLFLKYKVIPPDTLNLDNDDVRRLFEQQKIAIGITGAFGIASLKKVAPDLQYTVALMPGSSYDKPGRYALSGWSLGITTWAKNKDAARTFAQFMCKPEVDAYYTDALPGVVKAGDSARFSTPEMKMFLNQTFQHSIPMFKLAFAPTMYSEIVIALQRMLTGEDVATVANDLNAKVQGMIDSQP